MSSITKALKLHELDSLFGLKGLTPAFELEVSFPAGITSVDRRKAVELGNELTPSEASQEPYVSFFDPKATATTRYTILCLDPDAPSRTKNFVSPVNHWSQNGLQSKPNAGASADKINSEAPVLMPWRGPGPPIRTALHRYTFLLYREPSDKVFAPFNQQSTMMKGGTILKDRLKFDHPTFVKENRLELVAVKSVKFILVPSE